MKKLYYSTIIKPITDDGNKAFSDMADKEIKLKEELEEDVYKKCIFYFHNSIRQQLELPNKLFGFGEIIDDNIIHTVIILFDKEPDGNYYKMFIDEEGPYILVDEE